jgi:hypothetical protein
MCFQHARSNQFAVFRPPPTCEWVGEIREPTGQEPIREREFLGRDSTVMHLVSFACSFGANQAQNFL